MSAVTRFRSAARGIADDIVTAARSDDHTVHWLTADVSLDQTTVSWRAGTSLYGGTAGIALFLLEASDVLADVTYRDIALAALSWCERAAAESSNYSFYVGRLGIAYAMLRAGALTGDATYFERALRLAKGYESFLATTPVNDLLGGVAGTILGFLHLHRQTRERWTIDAVHHLVARLVSTARWAPEGLCWDVRPDCIKGLCGLSHGAAGVAFVLQEATAYLNEPAYRSLALEAIRYETNCYDVARGLWPDFRKFRRELSDETLTVPRSMDAWCHGAPGIGLARLRAMEIFGTEWRADSLRAITRTRATIGVMARSGFTLCHGACGNATLFLEASRHFDDPCYRSWAEAVGGEAIDYREKHGAFVSGYRALGAIEDLSLMMGTAGIGYFLLQLIGEVPNVLAPEVRGAADRDDLPVAEGTVSRALAKGLMPLSMSAIEARREAECVRFFSRWRGREEILEFVAGDGALAGAAGSVALEMAKLRMLDDCPSFALVTALREGAKETSAGLSDDDGDLDRLRLQLAPFTQLWPSQGEDDPPRLLRIAGTTVEEIELTGFSAAVLTAFSEPATLTSTISSFEESLEDSSEATTAALRLAVRAQLRSAIEAGLIVVAGA